MSTGDISSHNTSTARTGRTKVHCHLQFVNRLLSRSLNGARARSLQNALQHGQLESVRCQMPASAWDIGNTSCMKLSESVN